MREGAPVDPNLSLADMLPPDKADESRILQAAFALVAALARRTPSGKAEVTVTLDAEGWTALEAERRRYLRPHASYVYAPHPEGAGAVRLVKQGAVGRWQCARCGSTGWTEAEWMEHVRVTHPASVNPAALPRGEFPDVHQANAAGDEFAVLSHSVVP